MKARARITKALGAIGPHHCGTLALDTGYTVATVQRIVRQLVGAGLIAEGQTGDGKQDLSLTARTGVRQ